MGTPKKSSKEFLQIKDYNSKYNCDLVCPENLKNCYEEVPYSNVSNTMIDRFLKSEYFIDTLRTKHSIDEDSSSPDHHALRISSLINLILKNVDIYPIWVYRHNEQIEIDDGHHRFRAYLFIKEFLDKNILMPIHINDE